MALGEGHVVKRLFKLKQWLTLDETAAHLSILFDEPVSVADVLRLGLDGHLALSMEFVNHARARLGSVMRYADVPKMEVPALPRDGVKGDKTWTIPAGHLIDEVSELTADTRFVHFDDEVVSIDGVWDLAMMGNERIDVEFKFHQLTGGPEVTLTNIDGTFLKRADGTWASVQEHYDNNEYVKKENIKKPWSHPGNFYPAGGLPTDGVYVVRTDALRDFERATLADGSPFEAPFFDADSPEYPVLLAIAVRAWEAAREGTAGTPKQRVLEFLGQNYNDLPQGSRDAIAQVVNWQRGGGRPAKNGQTRG